MTKSGTSDLPFTQTISGTQKANDCLPGKSPSCPRTSKTSNKGVKPQSYAPGEKVWLNNKYGKIKCNRNLEAKFFGPFRILHLVGKQAYKLELPKKWRIHDVFHVSLLEKDNTRKERIYEVNAEELDIDNKREYKVKAIWDSAVYARESKSGYLPGLYYLVSWKRYP